MRVLQRRVTMITSGSRLMPHGQVGKAGGRGLHAGWLRWACDCIERGAGGRAVAYDRYRGNVFGGARATGARRRRLARQRRWPGGERSSGQRRTWARLGGRAWGRGGAFPAGGWRFPRRTGGRRARPLRGARLPGPRLRRAWLRQAGSWRARGRTRRAVVRHPAARQPAVPATAARHVPWRAAARTAVRPAPVWPAPVRAASGNGGSRPGRSRSQVPRRSGTGIRPRSLR